MTNVYFIRHCQPDTSVHDDLSRPLTEKGLADRARVEAYLADKAIDAVLSSPCRRAVDTVAGFADTHGLTVSTDPRLREREVGTWVADFERYARSQWADYDFALENGESLNQVAARCMDALYDILREFEGKNVAVGFHGTALCVLIHRFVPDFGFESFWEVCPKTPWAVRFTFDREACVGIEGTDLFTGESNPYL